MAGYLIKAEITGLKPLLNALHTVDKKLRNKVLRKAVKAGEKPIIRAARANVRVRSGMLRKSIGDKVKVYSSGTVVGIVGPRTGFKRNRQGAKAMTSLGAQIKESGYNPVKYAHLVEMGHRRGKGKSEAQPYPFLRPALEQNRSAAENAMATVIRTGLAI